MKNKIDQWIISIFFCAFLLGMLVLYLFLPKHTLSRQEKRYLAKTPVISWESLRSGDFSEKAEAYMADHAPGRNFFVGLNAYYKLLTGRQASEEILLTWDNRLVERPVQDNPVAVAKNMEIIRKFAEGIDAPVQLMIIPSSGWAAGDSISGLPEGYRDREIIQNIYAAAGEGIQTVDIVSAFAQTGQPEQFYYKTDHHWNSLGAYTAYREYMKFLGKPYRAQEDYRIETVPDFHGSTYSRSALWLTPGDTIELWHGGESLSVLHEERQTAHPGVFFLERLEEADKYTVFLDGNHSLLRVNNADCAGQGKLLVIRDSFSNCLGGFLADSYETVVLVDLRYYKKAVSELLKEDTYDQVLICYSLGNFLTDENIIWLR